MRYFFKPEIERIAARAEFHCLHAEEWLSGRGIGCDTWGVGLCCELNEESKENSCATNYTTRFSDGLKKKGLKQAHLMCAGF